RVMDTVLLRRDHRRLLEQVQGAFGFEQIVGQSPAMRRLFETIDKIADTDVTVLIRGGSGTGKELVANALHYRSARRQKPLVKMNCAALSRELVESELFGHEKGAFTGAIARREGKFEAADGGTLFRDEVGDMPIETQAKHLAAEALRACVAHPWKGNVRELRSAIEQALLLAPGAEIGDRDLFGTSANGESSAAPATGVTDASPTSFREAKERMVADFEKS